MVVLTVIQSLVQTVYSAGHVPITLRVHIETGRMVLVVNVRTRYAANCGLNPVLEAYCKANDIGVMAEFKSSKPRG